MRVGLLNRYGSISEFNREKQSQSLLFTLYSGCHRSLRPRSLFNYQYSRCISVRVLVSAELPDRPGKVKLAGMDL